MPAVALENCVITEQVKSFGGIGGGEVCYNPLCPECGKRNDRMFIWLRDGQTETDTYPCEQCNQTFRWSVAWT